MGGLWRLSRRLRFVGASELRNGKLSGSTLDAIRSVEVPLVKYHLDLLGDGELFASQTLEQFVGLWITNKGLSS